MRKLVYIIVITFFFYACGNQKKVIKEISSDTNKELFYPKSDPTNKGNWKLNSEVSDEFNNKTLDTNKWRIVGEFKDGKPTYENEDQPGKKEWIGRAPSQFSGKNFRLENGMLILETKWEPDFPFSDKTQKYQGKDYKHENITTACIISRKLFKYGYMEIRSKATDAEVTSSFWATGSGTEFDFFEMFGDHRQPNKEARGKDRELWWSIHDWTRDGKGKSTYTEHHDLGFRVADNFHTYGIEWDENGVKIYVDGKLFTEASRKKINEYDDVKKNKGGNGAKENYVITKPIRIWLDQETFPWHGVPDSKEDLELNSPEDKKNDGVVDFEIDYVRIWQKK